jgi:hypothetical protein
MCACRHLDHPKQHQLYTPPLLELLSAQYFFLGLKAAATTMWATEHIISVLSKLKAQSHGFKSKVGGHACSRHGHTCHSSSHRSLTPRIPLTRYSDGGVCYVLCMEIVHLLKPHVLFKICVSHVVAALSLNLLDMYCWGRGWCWMTGKHLYSTIWCVDWYAMYATASRGPFQCQPAVKRVLNACRTLAMHSMCMQVLTRSICPIAFTIS